MDEWRALAHEQTADSYLKMATEEAIMNAVRNRTSPPTLRFYSWNRPAVSLGYFQNAERELDLAACERDGIEIFRRLTGGGAVYKSPHSETNYSFIIREDEGLIPKDVEASYTLLCGAIITGLRSIGFPVEHKPINDITLFGKKISGNAQTRKDNVILHHGTILLHAETTPMFTYLRIPAEKLRAKHVTQAEELVTGLCTYKTVTQEHIHHAIIEGFRTTFRIRFSTSTLTAQEEKEAQELYPRYRSTEFIFWK
ncbi:MAG: lipoate--protein ligase family protein [Nitrosarchaeum sp.]|nr:lipoate--protein ligase family protein [Nitrosarchaeum sp.]